MKYNGNIDKECVAICDAINQIPGLETTESCCGHGEKEFNIWFVVNNPEHFPVLLYYCDPCHVGFRWDCIVTTDCGMSPVTYNLKSRSVGEIAYREARKIANKITIFLSERTIKQTLENYVGGYE